MRFQEAREQAEWRKRLTSGTTANQVADPIGVLRQLFEPLMRERMDLRSLSGPRHRSEPGYRWVPYKEAFSPDLVRTILDECHAEDGPLLDPFAGSGTSLLVAAERGRSAIGVERLPYAQWAANTVLAGHRADPERLRALIAAAATAARLHSRPVTPLAAPAAIWALPPGALVPLVAIRDALPPIGTDPNTNLAHLALLSVVESVSCSVKDGTSLRHRARTREGRTTRPGRKGESAGLLQVVNAFLEAGDRIIDDLPKMPDSSRALVLSGDARRIPLGNATIATAVFSPPYPNRYDYAAIYQLELAVGEFVTSPTGLKAVRRSLLRSHLESPAPLQLGLNDPLVTGVLQGVAAAADRHPTNERGRTLRMLVGYFDDMATVFTELARVLRPNAPVACVVSTQTYFGKPVPTDWMLASLARTTGLEVEAIWLLRRKHVAVQQRHLAAASQGRECVLVMRAPAR